MSEFEIDPGKLPRRNCDYCGGTDKKFLFKKYGYPIVRCSSCGLVFVDALLTEEQLIWIYRKNFFDADEGGRPEWSLLEYEESREITVHNFLKKLKRIEDVLPQGGRLLDVGCAHGYFIDKIRNKYDVYGVDVSEYATNYAVNKLGLANVRRGTMEDTNLPDSFFDIITMWNSLDHVVHPQKALEQANRLLKDGGTLVVYAEDIGCWLSKIMGRYWFPICPPYHLTYFDYGTMKRALSRAGFETLRQMKVGVDLRIKDVFNRLQTQTQNSVAYSAYKIIENTKVGGLKFNFGSGGNMFVAARKVRPPECYSA